MEKLGEWYQEGDWQVLKTRTRRPFPIFYREAVAVLNQGFPGIFATKRWDGPVCHIYGPLIEGQMHYQQGLITCKMRLTLAGRLTLVGPLFWGKIKSDAENFVSLISGVPPITENRVFIAHGHDSEALRDLKDYLTEIGLSPVILVEQDDMGMTIIEKFEHYAMTCTFATVLMTPDDDLWPEAMQGQKRVRQNVVMELGWFMARLGRERVVILSKGRLEIPSDIHGVVVLEFAEKVREVSHNLFREIRRVGLV